MRTQYKVRNQTERYKPHLLNFFLQNFCWTLVRRSSLDLEGVSKINTEQAFETRMSTVFELMTQIKLLLQEAWQVIAKGQSCSI